MEHYYAPQISDKNQLFELNDEESYHIVNVMRYKIGSNLKIVDGKGNNYTVELYQICLLYTSPSPRDGLLSRMPSSA